MKKGNFPGNWTLPDIIILSQYFNCNSITIRKNVQSFNSLSQYLINKIQTDNTLFAVDIELLMKELKNYVDVFINDHAEKNVNIISFYCENYPELLKHIEYPPILMYVKGNLSNDISLAIVGTRKPTHYGVQMAKQFSKAFSDLGVIVTSGLAYGIDTVVHKQVLDSKGKTYAVIASGIDSITPYISRNLSDRIVENGGAIISEYKNGTKALPPYFPQRNRIISGLSKAVLVVESDIKGGSMITAQFAFDQNRDVYAVPGHITEEMSKGTNLLIHQQKASLAINPESILKMYGLIYTINHSKISINENELPILRLIDSIPIHINDILLKSDIQMTHLLKLLLEMEFKGLIQQLPGSYYLKAYQ